MIKFELTHDMDLVHRCLTMPHVWRMSADDMMSSTNPNLLFVAADRAIWLKAGEFGVLILEPTNSIAADFHVALLPQARGRAIQICKDGLIWFFENTSCLRLTASVPVFNPLAIRLVRKIGMEFMGTNKKSFLKHGVLHDQQLFGISKEELCHS